MLKDAPSVLKELKRCVDHPVTKTSCAKAIEFLSRICVESGQFRRFQHFDRHEGDMGIGWDNVQ